MSVQRDRFKIVVQDLESVVSLYKIAVLIETRLGEPFQYVQIQRIKETGRCEHHIGEILLRLHSELVPHETLQIVPLNQARMMSTA